MDKRSLKIILIITVSSILISVFTSCSVLLPKEQEVLAPPLAEPPQPKYSFYKIARGDIIDQISGSGTFIPVYEYNMNFGDNSGRLLEINAKAGDFVRKGDLLAKLDVGDLEYNIKQMEVERKKTELNARKTRIDYEKLLADIEACREQLAAAAETEKGTIKNRLDDLLRQKEKSDIDREIQKLNNELQEMNYNRQLEKLKKAELRSPIDGIVNFANRLVVGDWINSWQNLFTVIDPSSMYLRVSSTGLDRLQPGMEAEVTIADKKYKGTVVMTPGSSNQQATEQRLRDSVLLTVENLPETVNLGDNASVLFTFDKRENVLLIPRAGLRNYGNRNYVVIRKDNINTEVDVTIGMQTQTMVEIISGIGEGEEIIMR